MQESFTACPCHLPCRTGKAHASNHNIKHVQQHLCLIFSSSSSGKAFEYRQDIDVLLLVEYKKSTYIDYDSEAYLTLHI